jgi:hypothetical protein
MLSSTDESQSYLGPNITQNPERGKQASAKLPQASDCCFDLRETFDDGESMDASGINVCADKTLNLTD